MESTTGHAQATKHHGSCHCGDVQFDVTIDVGRANKCNCTVCTKIGPTSGIVKPDAFVLLSETGKLGVYEWGPKISKRFFCQRCGVHCFGRGYLEEVGGDYVSVNLNCLDAFDPADVPVIYWDGRHDNWQAGPRPTPWPVLPAWSAFATESSRT